MRITNPPERTFMDYEGKIALEIFTTKCNYHCPACHGKELLNSEGESSEKFFEFWKNYNNKDWIDGLIVCGGEPTLEKGLISFLQKVKDKTGLAIKMDTNGSNPDKLKEILDRGLVDYVAMDIKAPEMFYADIAGLPIVERSAIKESMKLLSEFPDYEFRTTVVPVNRTIAQSNRLKTDEYSWMTAGEIGQTAEFIYKTTQNNEHDYILQKFKPQEGGLLDERLESYPETPNAIIEEGLKEARNYLPYTRKRGDKRLK